MKPMAEQSHSPGPWIPEGPLDNIHVVQLHSPHMRVCFLTSDGPTKANAYLIAASPNMLDALRAANQFITNGIELGYIRMPDADTPDSARDVPSIVQKAIAMAEGRKR